MRYATLGKVPGKRHVQVRRNGDGSPLLVEEVMGYEGFSGNESILLHLQSPCRLDGSASSARSSARSGCPTPTCTGWPTPTRWSPAATRSAAAACLMWNGDIEVSVCKPTEELERFYRNGEGDEVIYVHRGARRAAHRVRARARSASATTW